MKVIRFALYVISLLIGCGNPQEAITTKAEEIGKKVYSGPIIDMHIHAYTSESPLFGREFPNVLTGKSYMGSSDKATHYKETLAKFKKHRIVKAMVSNGEAWYGKDSSLVLIGRNHRNSIAFLREQYHAGKLHVLGEVAPSYDGLLPTDESLAAYLDLALELNIPIAYHMYPGGPPGGAYFAYPKTRASQAKPLQLEEILLSRPKMKIYIMHAGWPYLEDMKALLYAHPQVYVDLGVLDWGIPRKEFHHFLEGLVNAGYGKRIMFGSDQMEWPQTIDEAVEAIQSADFLTLEQKADIFYYNAARFLNFSKEEISKHEARHQQ